MAEYTSGNLIKGYKLEQSLGKGGEAEVWKAVSTEHKNIIVAIKLREPIPFKEREKLSDIKERVDRETESWLKFRSLYVTRLFDRFTEIQEWDSKEYIISGIVTEYSELGDLYELLLDHQIRNYIKNELDLVEFFLCIISGLQSGHTNNLIHCDIKPSNILLFMEGKSLIPKLTDFGISRAFHESNEGGTKGYMAPELEIQGTSPSVASDVYSLGITFYEIFYSCVLENITKSDLASSHATGEVYKKYIETLHEKTKNKTSLLPIDKYLSVFSSMVKSDPYDRINLDEVKRFLELNKGILLYENYPKLIKRAQENTYRWNPDTHRALNHNLYYVFLKGGIPNIDIDNFCRCLKEAHISGYSIHSVSGAWDYIMRVWIDKSSAHNKLEKALTQFNQTVDDPSNLQLEVLESFLFQKSKFNHDMSAEQVLNKIKKCIDENDRENEYNLLKTDKFILSKFDNEDNSNQFRVFVLIAIKGIPDKIIGLIGNQLKEIVNNHDATEETSMYLIGNNESGIKILLKFKHVDFLKCREVLMDVYNEGQSYRDQDMSIKFKYQTFFHMNSQKDCLSDDGDITEKLTLTSR